MLRLTLCLVVVLAAGLASGAQAANPPSLIRLISVTTSCTPVDVKPRGARKGDRMTCGSMLLNERAQFGKPKGATVGTDSGLLVYTSARTVRATTEAKLPGGTIATSGAIRPGADGSVVIPVTGGTGVFAGARGTLTIPRQTQERIALNVYRLTFAAIA